MNLLGSISGKRVDGEVLDIGEEVVDDVEVDRNVGDHAEGGHAQRRADTVDATRTFVA